MKIRGAWRAWLLLTGAFAGCDSEPPCSGDCPRLAGVYTVRSVVPSGRCGFAPYLLGTQLSVLQSEDGSRASANLLDPVTQLETRIAGDVFAPEGAGDDTQGSILLRTQTVRAAGTEDGTPRRLQVTLGAALLGAPPERKLAGSLRTTDLSGSGCQSSLQFTAEEVAGAPRDELTSEPSFLGRGLGGQAP